VLVEREPPGQDESKHRAGVAPEVASFLIQLAANPTTPAFTATNYPSHGLGEQVSKKEGTKGFSVDFDLKTDRRGQRRFYPVPLPVHFQLALDATAKALGARWRVLYNDFRVAGPCFPILVVQTDHPAYLNWVRLLGLKPVLKRLSLY
jgi:hypothetical protein